MGLGTMEAMANPLTQWHNEPSYTAKQRPSHPVFRSGHDDPHISRLFNPPGYSTTPLLPQSVSSYNSRDATGHSTRSGHSSTPWTIERSPPYPSILDDPYPNSVASQGRNYDYLGSSNHSKAQYIGPGALAGNRTDETFIASQHVLSETPRQTTKLMLSGQPEDYTPISRPGQTPQQPHVVSPVKSQIGSPQQNSRKTMSVRALLNDSTTVAPAASADIEHYQLIIRQQPVNARSCGFGDRDRRVIDPPPILELKIKDTQTPQDEFDRRLRNCFNIVHCSIWSEDGTEEMSNMPEDTLRQKRLMGNMVASPFVGLDEHGKEGCFFAFTDVSCRTPGRYRLKFSLVTVNPRPHTKSPVKFELLSDVFQTYSAKDFPGMSESTPLAKALRQQGCSIPTKKGNEKSSGGKRDDSNDISDEGSSPRRKRFRKNH